jgi:signal transduction histidine kinase
MRIIVDTMERARADGPSSEAFESIAIFAHECRTPLGAIRNAVGVLQCTAHLSRAADDARMLISRQVDQLSALIEDLIDLASITHGRLALRKERVDIVTVIQTAAQTCAPFLAAAGRTFSQHLPTHSVYATADSIRLCQVIINLLDNAAKYTEKFGRVELTLESRTEDIVLCVSDNGIGIAAEALPYVFDLWARAGSSSQKSPSGLGIGLALVKRIVELHGGTVHATSEGVGKGTTIVVQLPKSG